MKRSASALCLALFSVTLLYLGFKLDSPVAARETWTAVKSSHFYLTGNASEKEIRKVATNLEQFRDVFSRLFPKANLNGMALVIKDGARTLKFNTSSPERVQFITFTQDVNQSITCGKLSPEKLVVVTYLGSTDARSAFDGEPVAVEFVKPEQK